MLRECVKACVFFYAQCLHAFLCDLCVEVQFLSISSRAELPFVVPTIVETSWFIASFPVLVLIPSHSAVSGPRAWKSTLT